MDNPAQDPTLPPQPPSDDNGDVAFNTFIGVVVSVCGNMLISVALNVQKLAHNKIQENQVAKYFANMDEPPRWISTAQSYYPSNAFFPDDGYSSPRSSAELPRSEQEELDHQKFIMAMAQEQTRGESDYLKSKLWWLGISLMVLGEVGNFVAYGFAPASTIAPLGTTTLVTNVILAPLMLKEVFRKRDLLGVLLAVLGAAMVVLSSNSKETALSPDLIMEALTQTRSLVFFIITGIMITALTILSPIYGSQSIMIDLGLVAIYGGYTVLCTKSVSSLLSLTFFKMFAYPVSYVLILVLVLTAILQIKYLNKALQRFDSTEVIPTQFVLFTISAIAGSAVLYHDFDDMTMDQTSRFMTGCAVEFLGVYLITSKRDKQPPPLSVRADSSSSVEFTTTSTNNTPVDEAVYVSETDEAVLSSDHNGANSTSNNPAGTVQPAAPPRSSSSPHAHFAPDPTFPRRSLTARTEGLLNPNRMSAALRSSTATTVPVTHDEWHGSTNNNNAAATAKQQAHRRRRRSSVFRGISLTSQLVDRINEEPPKQQPIQLPPSSPTWQQAFGLHHRRGDSLGFSNLISGLTGHNNHQGNSSSHSASAATGIITSGASSPSHHPSTPVGSHHHDSILHIESDADAVEIDIPTASTISSQRNSEDDRELVPMGSKRNSARLVDIEENTEYRDLS
ncbi:magnesium transporter NIPA-domain-containing protein [Zychaea mexicana]|uniref:magnesium transporter NIPA-domain-containing protein n=1 Tax=Zychaea mexicana TaxID=64656 RepID=UPI0022FE9080|nr:magnesium transporter NIPA-domain-containing protein [Zychaea mexicana]KAI9489951.1 magnesium transporter NIPA-domain-containing protein [Zychaea mexicana]